MLTRKLIILSAALFTLGAGATEAQAGYGRSYCRPVAQSIKIGKFIRYTEYGTACNQTGGWVFVSENPHPRRYGHDVYFMERGRYVPVNYIYSPRYGRKWDRHDWRDDRRDRHDHDDHHDRDWDRHDRHDRRH